MKKPEGKDPLPPSIPTVLSIVGDKDKLNDTNRPDGEERKISEPRQI